MSAVVSNTPEPVRRNDACENDGLQSSERVKDIFSPRSAAAMALSSFSKQESDFAASGNLERPPTSAPSTAPAMPHRLSLEDGNATMRRASVDHPGVMYDRNYHPMHPMVPPSAMRRPGMHPSPPNGVRFHYPPPHHFPPNAPHHLHPMPIPSSMPLHTWTPQHRPSPQHISSGHRQDGPPPFRQPMLHPHLPYSAPWESRVRLKSSCSISLCSQLIDLFLFIL